MKNIKVAFFDTKPYDREFFDKANEKFGFQLTYFETRLGPASARMAAGFDAVSAFVNDDVGEETVKELIRLGVKVIAMRCAGYNNVNLAAAYGKILVMRVPGYSPYAVAEYALAMLQTLNRSLHRAYNRIRENNFSINGLIGFDLRGKTFGIVGTGKIGRVFAELLQGFGVRLLAYDVFPNREAAKALHMEYVSLEKLYAESDVISLHCPLTPDNIHLINADAIARMKQGVYLINTSRGKLVDTAALIAGLKSRKIGGPLPRRLRGGERLLLRRPFRQRHRRRHPRPAADLPQRAGHLSSGVLHPRGDDQHRRGDAAERQRLHGRARTGQLHLLPVRRHPAMPRQKAGFSRLPCLNSSHREKGNSPFPIPARTPDSRAGCRYPGMRR